MKFPNAQKGIAKIFAAELLGLISTICLVVTVILGILAKTYSNLTVPMLIGSVTALVMMLIGYILSIVGISQASKDEPSFRVSLYVVIFGIVFALTSGFFTNAYEGNEVVSRIVSVVPDIINLLVMIYIVMGIRNLAVQMGDPVMDGKGKNILNIVFVMSIIIFVVRTFSGMFSTETGAIIAIVALGFAGLLSIVSYILYLIYLEKAKKMLSE